MSALMCVLQTREAYFPFTRSLTRKEGCILPVAPRFDTYKESQTAVLTAQCVGGHYPISVGREPSPCGLAEPGSCWPQLERGFFTSFSSRGRPGLAPQRVGAADDTCRTSNYEPLEPRKPQPSWFRARRATAITLSSESLPS